MAATKQFALLLLAGVLAMTVATASLKEEAEATAKTEENKLKDDSSEEEEALA